MIAAAALLRAGTAEARAFVPADETHVRILLNQTRASKGRAKLALNDQLVAMARGQASRMADRGDIYHNPDLAGEITRRGLDWLKVGENVGMGPNVDMVEDAFIQSEHHYENIIDPRYDVVGVGALAGDDGRMYVVQVFADLAGIPAPAATAKPSAPPTVAPARTFTPAATAAPTPAALVVPRRSIEPNAVIGGMVRPAVLPRVPAAGRAGFLQALSGAVRRAAGVIVFWA